MKRVEDGGDAGTQSLLLTFSCIVCNPVNAKGMDLNDSIPFLESLHNLYSEHLFRAAVGHIMRGLKREGVSVVAELEDKGRQGGG